MKSRHLIFRGKRHSLIIVTAMLLFSACINGYKDDWTFSSGVAGVTLESPDPEFITGKMVDENTISISWKVVMGAGGYDFSLYNVDDPENPILVGEEHEIIDGCTVKRPLVAEDTKYKVVIKTLGSKQKDNADASSSVEKSIALMTIKQVPSTNSDLTAYFEENGFDDKTIYELSNGTTYSLSKSLEIGEKNVVIRSDKNNRAKITVNGTGAQFLMTTGKLKLEGLDFDCNALTSNFVMYNAIPASAPLVNTYAFSEQVALESCNVTGLKSSLISVSSSYKYALKRFYINNCIFAEIQNVKYIDFYGGSIVNLIITNSTFYNKSETVMKSNFFNFSNVNPNGKITPIYWTLSNNTFYNISVGTNFMNVGQHNQKTISAYLTKNMFVTVGNNNLINKLGSNVVKQLTDNNYWFKGGVATTDINDDTTNETNAGRVGSATSLNPEFADAANGDFTINSIELAAKKVGDPRWLK